MHDAVGIECRTFFSKLSELLATKRDLPKLIVTSWLCTDKVDVNMFTWLTFDEKQCNGIKRFDVQEKLTKNQKEH